MANRWYRSKHQPLKVLNLLRKAWRDQKWTHDDPPSFLLFPILPQLFNLLNCRPNIENCCTILGNYSLLFVTKITANITLSLNSSFHLPQFPGASFLPPKNIKVGPIIRIILVPPLSSVNRAVASLTVPGGQEFHFPHFFLKF